MKAKKTTVFLLMMMLVFAVSACSNIKTSSELGYNGIWHYNEEYHWRDKDEFGDDWKSKHNFIDDVCNLCGYSRKVTPPEDPDDQGDSDPSVDDPGDVGGEYEQGDTIIDGLSYTMLHGGDNGICYSVGVGELKGQSEIIIPSEYQGSPVVAIDDRGFRNDTALTSIKLPDTITTIGWEAFYNCSSLKKFDMPDSVTSVEQRAFFGCSGMKEIKLSNKLTTLYAKTFENCSSLDTIEFPEGMEKLNNDAFGDCLGLHTVIFPKSLKLLSYNVFINCEHVQKVVGYDLESWMNINFSGSGANPMHCGADLYFNSTGSEVLFTKLEIPDSIKKIKKATFAGCKSLTEVEIPERITEMGGAAFTKCFNIKKIVADGLTVLDDQAFEGAKSLESVSIKSVERINRDVFFGASKLTTVYFGKNIAKYLKNGGGYDLNLGQRSFANTALKDIYFEGTKQQWEHDVKKCTPSSPMGDWWNFEAGTYTVHCSDGTLTETGAVYTG